MHGTLSLNTSATIKFAYTYGLKFAKAYFPEIPIIVDTSCCAGTTPENHKSALQVMKSCHIDVINEEAT